MFEDENKIRRIAREELEDILMSRVYEFKSILYEIEGLERKVDRLRNDIEHILTEPLLRRVIFKRGILRDLKKSLDDLEIKKR